MNLHSLNNVRGAKRSRMRVGRGMGSGKGKTCGAGHKGQMARKGNKHKLGFEGGQMRLIRRIPKRGFTNPSGLWLVGVNISKLARFAEGTEVNASLLKSSGLARGRFDGIKILGHGELDRKLVVKVQAFSASARAKIEAAGGVCEVVSN
ncbi:MAG: 50S ribosomal protein L15 [Lentisphaerae bacterium]|nr:50S ribosomal protein L15 [Lentisphaerota bacterium]